MPQGIPNNDEMYGIYPVDGGFRVSVMREKTRHVQYFGAAEWGGEQSALHQARDYRDEIVKSAPPVLRRTRAQKVRTTNKSGTPGVIAVLRADESIQGWRAKTYIGPGQILQEYFAVSAHGDAARQLAILARAAQLEQMVGVTQNHPAEARLRTQAKSQRSSAPRKLTQQEIVGRNNTSGVCGVHFKSGKGEHPGYWLAITDARGMPSVSKAFSVKTLGFDKAKKLAIAERARQLAEKAPSPGAITSVQRLSNGGGPAGDVDDAPDIAAGD